MLTVRGLTRSFGKLSVLDDVTFTVAPGQLAVADGGEVLLDGRRLDETDPWMRSVVAAALDDIDFFPDLSVAEHLELLAYAHGGSAQPVDAVLSELGLDPARDQLPATLSSGQRRRLALASCFVRPRRLLVLDEPEQRLDVRGRAWLTDRLRQEKAAGTAVLMASHDPDLIDAVADVRIEIGA